MASFKDAPSWAIFSGGTGLFCTFNSSLSKNFLEAAVHDCNADDNWFCNGFSLAVRLVSDLFPQAANKLSAPAIATALSCESRKLESESYSGRNCSQH